MTGGNIVQVSGRLTLDTAAALFGNALALKDGVGDVVIDLAQVEMVDSSAVSLMLSWLRAAQHKNVKLTLMNVPDNLISLANLYGVAETLSLRVEV